MPLVLVQTEQHPLKTLDSCEVLTKLVDSKRRALARFSSIRFFFPGGGLPARIRWQELRLQEASRSGHLCWFKTSDSCGVPTKLVAVAQRRGEALGAAGSFQSSTRGKKPRRD
jgi:hypothetical protein